MGEKISLKDLRSSNPATFNPAYKIMNPDITRVVRRIITNPHTVEDLTQETWANVLFRAKRGGIADESIEGYLAVSAKNTALGEVRKGSLVQRKLGSCYEFDEARDHVSSLEAEQLAESEMYKKLKAVIGDQWSRIIYLTTLGYEYAEVANILDIPIGTVSSSLRRARKKIVAHAEEIFGPGADIAERVAYTRQKQAELREKKGRE